jgi:hypothetical protein
MRGAQTEHAVGVDPITLYFIERVRNDTLEAIVLPCIEKEDANLAYVYGSGDNDVDRRMQGRGVHLSQHLISVVLGVERTPRRSDNTIGDNEPPPVFRRGVTGIDERVVEALPVKSVKLELLLDVEKIVDVAITNFGGYPRGKHRQPS